MNTKIAVPMEKATYYKIAKIRRLVEIIYDVQFKSVAEFINWAVSKAIGEIAKEIPKEEIQKAISKYFSSS